MVDRLNPGQCLYPSQSIASPDELYTLTLQKDSNLVLYKSGNQAIWNSGTAGKNASFAIMQATDGNFVLYGPTGALWASGTGDGQPHPGAFLRLQDDGNLVLYVSINIPLFGPITEPLWATNTVPRITIGPQLKDLSNGHFMTSNVELNLYSLKAHCDVNMTCTNKIDGFTCGVQLLYYDAQKNLLGKSPVQQYGVNQAPLIGATHRPVSFEDQAPAGTEIIALAQFADPKNRFGVLGDIGDTIANFFVNVATAIEDVAKATAAFCKQDPFLCGFILICIAGIGILASGGTLSIVIIGGAASL